MRVRRWTVPAAVVAVLAPTAVAAPASAAGATTRVGTVVVRAADDAYTSSSRRTANFGTAGKLAVGRAGRDTKISYVRFVVGRLPAGARVTGAEVRLPLASRPAGGTISLVRVATGWTERSVTARRAPVTGATVASVRPSRGTTVLRFSVSRIVTRPGVYAFAVRSSARSVTRLRSAESGRGPELRLTVATTVPARPAPQRPAPGKCVTGALLVPSCGVLWGAAAGGFTTTPRDQALKDWESLTGRTATIFHQYHKGDEKFPTKAEIAMTRDPAKPRVLLLNWKVAYGTTWAAVARGEKNARIDNWAAYVKSTYPEKFFLALHHEPENDVNPTPGSGMTATDYAAMYRHVITRLRAHGLTNAVNVLAYMGNEKWMAKSWWPDLYPGDDVVDWIGLDSYVSAEPGYYHYGMFADLLDRRPTGGGTGFYDWATTAHPGKPVMVAEWGVYHRTTHIVDKSPAFASVASELRKRPAIKAVVYFDTERDDEGDRNISVASTPQSLATFRDLAADPLFNVDLR
jgi:beta-mannanase